MRRLIALLLLAVAIAPGTWLRSPIQPLIDELVLHFVALPIGKERALGPFRLDNAWRIESRNRRPGSYSALVALGDGQLLTLSDDGGMLRFSPPGAPQVRPVLKALFKGRGPMKQGRDVESATLDLASGKVWAGLEFRNAVVRFDYRDGELTFDKMVRPQGMANWGDNSGPESLVRLRDGRFVALREGFSDPFGRTTHAALLFAGDPVEDPKATRFTMIGPRGYSPTDAAQLPDGRLLVLFRRLLWPFPARFAGAIAIGDPAAIRQGKPWPLRTLATWSMGLPIDNFEGLAIEPGSDGRLTVWLISDDNRAAFQRTVLWKMSVDPADLPQPGKKARGNPARPA